MAEPVDQFTVTWVTGGSALSKPHNRRVDAMSRYALLRADPLVFYGQVDHNGKIERQFVQRAPGAEKIKVIG